MDGGLVVGGVDVGLHAGSPAAASTASTASTRIRFLLRVAGSNRTRKAHLWVGIGDADYPYVLFDFTSDYTADGPTRFLQGYKG